MRYEGRNIEDIVSIGYVLFKRIRLIRRNGEYGIEWYKLVDHKWTMCDDEYNNHEEDETPTILEKKYQILIRERKLQRILIK